MRVLSVVFTCLLSISAGAETLIRMGTVAPSGTPWERHVNGMKKRVAKSSGGEIKFKIYLGGQKGDEKSLVRQVKAGRLEGAGLSTAALATEVPALEVLELPYLFDSSEEADFVLDQFLYEPVKKIAARYGFVFYQWAENGWQNFGAKKFIKSKADLAGQKMRSQEAPVHLATWRSFGASPVEMAVSEVLPALQTGQIEGFAQTPLFTFAAGWHQGISHYTVSRHVYQPGAIVFSKKFLDGEGKSAKNLVLDESVRAVETQGGRDGVRAIEPGLVQNFKAYGIQVHTLSDAERQAFKLAAASVHQSYLKTASKDGKLLYALIQKGKKAFKNQK